MPARLLQGALYLQAAGLWRALCWSKPSLPAAGHEVGLKRLHRTV